MFERRLRLFLFFVFVFGLVLAVRAAYVQVIDRVRWNDLAASAAQRVQYLPAKRGDLLDLHNRVIATDVTRFDVAVNFCVVPSVPDADFLKVEATRRAKLLDEYKAADDAEARSLIISQETQHVREDLEQMWDTISQLTGVPRQQIDATRRGIAEDVEGKHDAFWHRRYEAALDAYEHAPTPPWYVRFITGKAQRPDEETIKRESTINDQEAFHTVVADLTPAAYAQLLLMKDDFPQFRDSAKRWQSVMTLRPSVRREYPYGDVAAHVIGRVGIVSAEDREADPNKNDERRRYTLVDRIGRDGLERLAEQQLRGTLGQRVSDRSGVAREMDEADAGKPVKTTIDIELQRDVQNAFHAVTFAHPEKDANDRPTRETLPMNGAAVVIDIATGEVRALVSVPTYDLNHFDAQYARLLDDEWNGPLRNRALNDAVEPGSAVKPIIGLGAITQHLFTTTDTIHCEGYAFFNGRRVEKPRCWTMSIHKGTHQTLGHPHATGDLTLADAIERSCNVYFLTLGGRLGIERESYWMKQFGLGQITGIGLPENPGLVPSMARIESSRQASSSWYAAIGQGPVAATPIQIANEIATIARDGVWVRPRLLRDVAPPPTTRPDGSYIPERVDLHLDPTALAEVHRGMMNVVGKDSGTGISLRRSDVLIAAKTGSATAAPLSRSRRNADGTLARDEEGNVLHEFLPYGTMARPIAELPWYRRSGWNDTGRDIGTHSWVAGYAPADHPQVAFAVYVEYGGSGGVAAASVANQLVQSCINRGYITADSAADNAAHTAIHNAADEQSLRYVDPDPTRTATPINPGRLRARMKAEGGRMNTIGRPGSSFLRPPSPFRSDADDRTPF